MTSVLEPHRPDGLWALSGRHVSTHILASCLTTGGDEGVLSGLITIVYLFNHTNTISNIISRQANEEQLKCFSLLTLFIILSDPEVRYTVTLYFLLVSNINSPCIDILATA